MTAIDAAGVFVHLAAMGDRGDEHGHYPSDATIMTDSMLEWPFLSFMSPFMPRSMPFGEL